MGDEKDLDMIFQFYDKNGDGTIDYREFAMIFNNASNAEFNVPLRPSAMRGEV